MTTAAFISELIRAANEVERLTPRERSSLLQRAARTIRDMREEVALSGAPANDGGPGEMVHELIELSERVHEIGSDNVALALLDAAADMKALGKLAEERLEMEPEEE